MSDAIYPTVQSISQSIPGNTLKLLFKKTGDDLILIKQNSEPELQECELTKIHAIFCAKPITQGKTYFERTFYPEMNFALKI
jgi:hypothetical protein